MTTDSILIDSRQLRRFTASLFLSAGVPDDECGLIASSLVEANLCGHESHGVIRISEYISLLRNGGLHSGVDLQVVSETPALMVCDAQSGFGQVQMRRLIEKMIPKAESVGLACGTVRNCGHIGRLAEWCERTAEQGFASLLTVNDNGVLKCVAPPGGCDPAISTNPIAIGAPATPRPLVVDSSTSVVANGKIRVTQIAGRECPDGWLIDSDGQPTNDPNQRFSDPPGSILPMGGHKGFGLGLLMDALVGGLSGGQCPPAPEGTLECNNVLMIVFSPEHFGGTDHFLKQVADLADLTRSSRRIDPEQPIRLPGDRSSRLRSERLTRGVPVDIGTWSGLLTLAGECSVPIPETVDAGS